MVGSTPCHVGLHLALWGASHPRRGNLGISSWQVPHAIVVACTWHNLLPCARSCVVPCSLVEAASAPSHGRCRAASSWLSCCMVGLLIPSLRQPRRLLMIGARPHNGGLQMALWGASHPRRGNLGIPSSSPFFGAFSCLTGLIGKLLYRSRLTPVFSTCDPKRESAKKSNKNETHTRALLEVRFRVHV